MRFTYSRQAVLCLTRLFLYTTTTGDSTHLCDKLLLPVDARLISLIFRLLFRFALVYTTQMTTGKGLSPKELVQNFPGAGSKGAICSVLLLILAEVVLTVLVFTTLGLHRRTSCWGRACSSDSWSRVCSKLMHSLLCSSECSDLAASS